MKNYSLLLIACITLLIASCGKEGDTTTIKTCAELVCQHGGTKVEYVDGTCGCDCPERYSGQECQIDGCSGTACVNGDLEYDTNGCDCYCDYGYYGADCSQAANQGWVGTYVVTDNCVGSSYTITITAGDPPSGVVINNINNQGTSYNVAGSAYDLGDLNFSHSDATTNISGSFGQSSGVYTLYYYINGNSCSGSMIKQ